MVAILNNKMASTDRDYSPFNNSVFSVMAEDRPSILFVSSGLAKFDWKVVAHWATKYNNLVAQQ